MTGYFLTSAAVGLVGGVMAVWHSLFPRITSTEEEQARAACIRRHPSSRPAHIPGPRRQS